MNPFGEYRVTSPFGWRTSPITGAREFHTGIDLVKEHQGPIYAFVAGEVVHVKEGVTGSGFGGYGNVVAVRDLKTGHLHCYAHLYCAVVHVGDVVHRGQMIGRQGSTGQSTGSHLHYEIRKTSNPSYGWIADRANNCFEPTKYLQDYYAAEEVKPKMGPKPIVDKKAAEKVVDVLGALYMASADKEVQAAAHFAANALRDAAGIPG